MTLGVRAKFILVTICILAVTTGMAAFTGSWVFTREYSKALQAKAFVVGENMRSQLERLLGMGISIHELVGFDKQCQEVVERYDDLSYVMVADTEGRILFRSDGSRLQEAVTDPALMEAMRSASNTSRERWEEKEKYYDILVPVLGRHGEHVATVRLGFPARFISQRVNQLTQYSFMAFLVSAAFAVCLVIISSYIWITRPMGKLLSVIGEIIQGGPGAGKKVEIHSKDEIGRLASAFNQMTARLNESHERVTKYSEELEIKVEERTASLEAANTRLQRDILERRRAEAALRESEARFRIAAESASDLIYEWDIESGQVKWFGNVDEKLGDLPGHLPSTREEWLSFIHPEDRDLVEQAMKRHFTERDTFWEDYRIRPREGHYLYWTDRGRALWDDRSQAYRFIGVTTDITQHHLAEEALRESERRYRELADLLPQPVYETDANGNLSFANYATFNCFGFSREDFCKGINLLDLLADEEHPRASEHLLRQLGGQKAADQEYTALGKDGARFPVMVSSGPIMRDGVVAGLRGIMVDIRGRKANEEQLAKIQRLESLGILAGGIAHDFNNIMAAILGNISLANLYLEPSSEPRKVLTEAEKATIQAKGLTQQLITFSEGGLPTRTTQSIKGIVEDAVRFGLSGSNLKAELRCADDLQPVDCDSGQINQALVNLIINAKEAMPDGGTIEVEAANEWVTPDRVPALKEGEYVRLSIIDHGAGISGDILPKIFDPYFSTKQRGPQKGMGLGLTISYSIVKRHDGDILVESERNRGTAVHVFLPASLQEVTRQEVSARKEDFLGTGRVLVMDDEKMLRDLAEKMLKRMGYEAESAKDGAEAIERYQHARDRENPFDVVILDLTVPGAMGGREALKKLREIDPSVKAVVLTGYANDPVVHNFDEYGFEAAIVKPFRLRELSDVLKKVLNT
jgi:PAS domain S-box-containing protein